MKRLLLSVAALAVCASLAIAADAPKWGIPKTPAKTTAAPAQIKDSAMQQIEHSSPTRRSTRPSRAGRRAAQAAGGDLRQDAHLLRPDDHQQGPDPDQVPARRGPHARDQLHLPDEAGLLRRPHLPPRHHQLHGPGRRPARHRHRRPRLPVRRRVQPEREARQPGCSRWPTPAPAPTAASSSSPSWPRPGWTASTPSSARWSRAWTRSRSSRRRARRAAAPPSRSSMEKVTIEVK